MRKESRLASSTFPSPWEARNWHLWKLAFEHETSRIPLLVEMIRQVPNSLGEIEFWWPSEEKARSARKFVLLMTHDFENEAARQNELETLIALFETRALSVVGVEGSAGELKGVAKWRSYPDPESLMSVAMHLFRMYQLSPIEMAALCCKNEVLLWGIETPAVYLGALNEYRQGLPDRAQTLDARVMEMSKNLLRKMEELECQAAGASVFGSNFWEVHRLLEERGIAHAGVAARLGPISRTGLLEKRLRNEPYDEEEARLWEMFGGWKRPWYRRFWDAVRGRRLVVTGELEVPGEARRIFEVTRDRGIRIRSAEKTVDPAERELDDR